MDVLDTVVFNETQTKVVGDIKEQLTGVITLITDTVPDSRYRSLTITRLEEAAFWVNKGVSRTVAIGETIDPA